ncbi:MAG: replicative DNA helicase [Candidatus Aminicenantia bacterium]
MELDFLFLKKTPPHSFEAERAVLGGILVQNSHLNTVLSIITPQDFYKEAHRKIINTIISLVDKGKVVDLLSLTEALQKEGELESAGGISSISSLMDGVPKSLNIEYYAQIIKEKALLRKLIFSSAKIISDSYEEKLETDELLDQAQSAILEAAEERIHPGFLPMKIIAEQTLEGVEALSKRKQLVTGLPTGFRDLDSVTSGLHNSDFIVLAGRPSMGKTALALNISQYIGTKTDKSVGIFTLEMAKEQLVIRMLCAEAKVDIQKVRNGFISDQEWRQIVLAFNKLAETNIFVDETAALTVMEMKAKARRLKMERKLDLLVVDYMQLMRGGARFENRTQEISYISRSMKELAKELQIPVIGVSQLSRAPERGRRESRPQLSDLRESGAIEQDADMVIFIYREEMYRPTEENQGIADLIIAKQRNGPTGIIKLAFIKEFSRFADLEFRGIS